MALEQVGDHRLPVTKLLIGGLTTLSGGNFMSVVALNVVVLAGVAAGGIAVMRRVRGRTSLMDLYFPLVLMPPFSSASTGASRSTTSQ